MVCLRFVCACQVANRFELYLDTKRVLGATISRTQSQISHKTSRAAQSGAGPARAALVPWALPLGSGGFGLL